MTVAPSVAMTATTAATTSGLGKKLTHSIETKGHTKRHVSGKQNQDKVFIQQITILTMLTFKMEWKPLKAVRFWLPAHIFLAKWVGFVDFYNLNLLRTSQLALRPNQKWRSSVCSLSWYCLSDAANFQTVMVKYIRNDVPTQSLTMSPLIQKWLRYKVRSH